MENNDSRVEVSIFKEKWEGELELASVLWNIIGYLNKCFKNEVTNDWSKTSYILCEGMLFII